MTSSLSLTTGMLAFARSVQLSEALMWARPAISKGAEGETTARLMPIEVVEKGVRGQISEADAKKNDGKSNPQTIDSAMLPSGCDALVISYGVRVLASAMAPNATDSTAVRKSYIELAGLYAEAGGFEYLAERYVWNILNGRFAWRNRMQTDKATVDVVFGDTKVSADPLMIDLDLYPGRDALKSALTAGSADDLDTLISGFARGLTGKLFSFGVTWTSELEPGAEVWPSQEYIREDVKRLPGNSEKSRFYASIPCDFHGRRIKQASIHSQKIGAALRHIDDWHLDADYGVIAVNPYGGVQETGAVLRPLHKGDARNFYAIMDTPDALFADMQKGVNEMAGDTHFFFANLLRGGVFGKLTAEKKAAKDAGKKARADAKSKGKATAA